MGEKVVTEYLFDGYDPVLRFREKLQAFSSDLPPDLGVGGIFDQLVASLMVATAHKQIDHYRELGNLDGGDGRHFLRAFVFQLIGANRPYMSGAEKELMLATPVYYTPTQEVAAWLEVAELLLPETSEEGENSILVQILRHLQRHPQYHGLLLEQARELSESSLSFGDDLSGQVARLADLVPDPAYRHTSTAARSGRNYRVHR